MYRRYIRRPRGPRYGGPGRNIAIPFGKQKLEWCGYPTVKSLKLGITVATEYRSVTDRQTDRQTSCDGKVRAMHIASRGNKIREG